MAPFKSFGSSVVVDCWLRMGTASHIPFFETEDGVANEMSEMSNGK